MTAATSKRRQSQWVWREFRAPNSGLGPRRPRSKRTIAQLPLGIRGFDSPTLDRIRHVHFRIAPAQMTDCRSGANQATCIPSRISQLRPFSIVRPELPVRRGTRVPLPAATKRCMGLNLRQKGISSEVNCGTTACHTPSPKTRARSPSRRRAPKSLKKLDRSRRLIVPRAREPRRCSARRRRAGIWPRRITVGIFRRVACSRLLPSTPVGQTSSSFDIQAQ